MYNNLPKTLFIGRSVIYLPTCHSTNDIAASILGKPETFEGTVVVTSNQTAGKGQRGNVWEAEPFKNLTFSIILKPDFLKVSQQFNLNITISLAVYDVLTIYLKEKVKIKWPNDIFLDDAAGARKLGGILIQNFINRDSIAHSIAGIGININQRNFRFPQATSLASVMEDEYDLEILFLQLMEAIEARYLALKAGGEEALKREYLSALYRFGELRPYKAQDAKFMGTIRGIDETGRLRIFSEGKERVFSFKEVEFVE